jgi:hypothetical protein
MQRAHTEPMVTATVWISGVLTSQFGHMICQLRTLVSISASQY